MKEWMQVGENHEVQLEWDQLLNEFEKPFSGVICTITFIITFTIDAL